MSTDWKTKCLKDISPGVVTPDIGYAVMTAASVRIPYKVNGENRCVIAAGDELPAFLKKYGLIDHYAYAGGEVKLYIRTIITTYGHRGQIVISELLVPRQLGDIEISRERAHTIAVHVEFEIAYGTMNSVSRSAKQLCHLLKPAA